MNWERWGLYAAKYHNGFKMDDLKNTPKKYKLLVALAMTIGKWHARSFRESYCGLCLFKEIELDPYGPAGELSCFWCIASEECNGNGLWGEWMRVRRRGRKQKDKVANDIIKYLEDLYRKEYRMVFR